MLSNKQKNNTDIAGTLHGTPLPHSQAANFSQFDRRSDYWQQVLAAKYATPDQFLKAVEMVLTEDKK